MKTDAIVIPAPADGAKLEPEFLRLPPNGLTCPVTGLRRSFLNGLILPSGANGFKPPVKSICLRRPGSAKGVRLISYASLLGYLKGLEREQNPEAAPQAEGL